tara:strand:- start:3577 stop:5256 length:1680 start_codon:yes stop_codon:yes gene_type:complete
MKIPHNFAVNPVAAPRVRKVNDRTLQADAIMAQADQQMTATVGKVAGTANEIYQGHIQKQYDSDMIAGGAMLDQLKAKRDGEISNIPVGQGIDRAGEVKKINDRYNSEWTGWSGKNIRNQGHRRVASDMQMATDAFANDGATYSAKQGVVYDQAVNVSNINMSSGVYASQLKANPEDAGALSNLKRDQDALFAAGAQDEATTAANKASIGVKALEMQDANKVLRAEVLSGDGKFEESEEVLDGLSGQYTKDEITVLKKKTLANGSFNSMKLIGQNTNTEAGWKEFNENITANKYLTANQKTVLKSQSKSGTDKIMTSQQSTQKSLIADAKKGIYDPVVVSDAFSDDSKDGLSMVGGPKLNQLLTETVSLYDSAKQVKEDGKLWKAGSKATSQNGIASVGNFNRNVTDAQLEGSMSQEMFRGFVDEANKRVKDGDWSPALGREAKRNAMNAFQSSLEGENAIMGITDTWRLEGYEDDVPMPESVKNVYRSVNDAFQDQKLMVNEYIDAAPYYAEIEQDLKQWSSVNPNPSPVDIQEKIEKLIKPIKLKTIDRRTLKNANR